jgi:dihydrofolate reductase
MIAAIWAQSPEGIIGFYGKIPWHFSGDFRRFKRVTLDSAIIMGRKTYDSIGKPLPKRHNIVLSRYTGLVGLGLINSGESVAVATTLEAALDIAKRLAPDTWIIGGAGVYAAAMPHVDLVDVTTVPRACVALLQFDDRHLPVFAPKIDPDLFWQSWQGVHEDEPTLTRARFVSRRLKDEPYELTDNRRLQEQGSLTKERR